MQLRTVWRAHREPGERMVGWALLLPGGRGVVIGGAFVIGVLVPLLLPCSVLVAAWAYGSGRRLAILTDRRLILLRAGRGAPRLDVWAQLGSVRVASARGPDDPVRVRLARADGREGWFRPVGNGVEHRFVAGLRALSRAEASEAVC